MSFTFRKTKIEDVVLIEPELFGDNRGYFMETYKYSVFKKNGIEKHFVQDNQSLSMKNVLRGLHYQLPPFGQAKLVRCIKGKIFDVAVDVRKKSKTCGQWVGVELSEENKRMLYIPEGFAHGFLTLSEKAEIHYKMSSEYSPAHERGIIWNDTDIGIDWEIENIENVILSPKDMKNPAFQKAELFC